MKLMLRRDLKPGDLFVYVDQVTCDDDPELDPDGESTKGQICYVVGGKDPDPRLGASPSPGLRTDPSEPCDLSDYAADCRVIRIKKGSAL